MTLRQIAPFWCRVFAALHHHGRTRDAVSGQGGLIPAWRFAAGCDKQ